MKDIAPSKEKTDQPFEINQNEIQIQQSVKTKSTKDTEFASDK